jgi:dTDP-L-rhamnose 4-epimerase
VQKVYKLSWNGDFMKVLVTGGAGFIGSFIVDKLVSEGHEVRIFDNLDEQVHSGKKPDYLNKKAEFVKGDVTDYKKFSKVISDVDVVFHEAAAVGVGQSMYQVKHYVNVNTLGTANLLDILVNQKHDVKKVIVAASMSSYGEGAYSCENCGIVRPDLRPEEQMEAKDWEPKCPKCKSELKPIGTAENQRQICNSIYAITKKDQEDMLMNIGKTYGIPCVALRYFNVYGPRQSLSNPYTGVAAIFLSRIKNNNAPVVYEDGNQTRDFISVHDIADANIECMKNSNADYNVFNVGTGIPLKIKGIAETLAKLLDVDVKPLVTNKFRKGDIRHCYADISKIKSKLGWHPKVSFEEGMKELIEWSKKVKAEDKFQEAASQLKEKGLI